MSEKQSNTLGRGRGRGRPEETLPLPDVEAQGRRKHSVSEKGNGKRLVTKIISKFYEFD